MPGRGVATRIGVYGGWDRKKIPLKKNCEERTSVVKLEPPDQPNGLIQRSWSRSQLDDYLRSNFPVLEGNKAFKFKLMRCNTGHNLEPAFSASEVDTVDKLVNKKAVLWICVEDSDSSEQPPSTLATPQMSSGGSGPILAPASQSTEINQPVQQPSMPTGPDSQYTYHNTDPTQLWRDVRRNQLRDVLSEPILDNKIEAITQEMGSRFLAPTQAGSSKDLPSPFSAANTSAHKFSTSATIVSKGGDLDPQKLSWRNSPASPVKTVQRNLDTEPMEEHLRSPSNIPISTRNIPVPEQERSGSDNKFPNETGDHNVIDWHVFTPVDSRSSRQPDRELEEAMELINPSDLFYNGSPMDLTLLNEWMGINMPETDGADEAVEAAQTMASKDKDADVEQQTFDPDDFLNPIPKDPSAITTEMMMCSPCPASEGQVVSSGTTPAVDRYLPPKTSPQQRLRDMVIKDHSYASRPVQNRGTQDTMAMGMECDGDPPDEDV